MTSEALRGLLREARTIAVGSRVGGRVKEVFAKEGDRVEPGKALLELEPGDLPAQRLIAKGELDGARREDWTNVG